MNNLPDSNLSFRVFVQSRYDIKRIAYHVSQIQIELLLPFEPSFIS